MNSLSRSNLIKVVPLVASTALLLAACGSDGGSSTVAQEPQRAAAPAATDEAPAPHPVPAAADVRGAEKQTGQDKAAEAAAAPRSVAAGSSAGQTETAAKAAGAARKPAATTATTAKAAKGSEADGNADGRAPVRAFESAAEQARNATIAKEKNYTTEVGVTKDAIKLGSINMHGMALGNVLVAPIVRGLQASYASINDRGGVLGRRLSIVDCDDGPGEVSRAKACIKKLAGQDEVFALLGGASWSTASIHDDLKQQKLPFVGAWAYSQTEWQDPYMFPAHMSMIHEAMAGANWVKNVVKPKTYGLICLTSPEMQLACDQVSRILDASGSKLVKKADVSISETSMSATVLSMRAANPEHIVHYVINPATMAKFMVEAAQQGYYPPMGISGNHLAAEVLGSLFGKWPVGRYWTNTTYKLWGPEFMATMEKYARGNSGENHHIVQAGYVAANIFAQAGKEVGPNLTRARLMAVLGNGTVWTSDASLDQRFAYVSSERQGDNWNKEYGQGREFMYKYNDTNTMSNPDGSPNGWAPDPGQFVLYTWR
jgi:ABC-type branched-subunit amino acid transport system substrate-binding protein